MEAQESRYHGPMADIVIDITGTGSINLTSIASVFVVINIDALGFAKLIVLTRIPKNSTKQYPHDMYTVLNIIIYGALIIVIGLPEISEVQKKKTVPPIVYSLS